MTRIFLFAILGLFATACGKPVPDVPVDEGKANLTLSCESISVSSDAAQQVVTVTSEEDWGVAPEDKSWISVSPSGGGKGTSGGASHQLF